MRTGEHGRRYVGLRKNELNRLWAAGPTQFRVSISCQRRESIKQESRGGIVLSDSGRTKGMFNDGREAAASVKAVHHGAGAQGGDRTEKMTQEP